MSFKTNFLPQLIFFLTILVYLFINIVKLFTSLKVRKFEEQKIRKQASNLKEELD